MNKKQALPKVVNFDYNKHLPQTSAEKTSDLFFVLSTAYLAARIDKELTKLMLEKALFKASQIFYNQNLRFLNTFFFINKFGPHNNIFYKYLEELENAGLIDLEGNTIGLTAKGLRVASEVIEEATDNEDLQKILVVLEKKIKDYSEKPGLAVDETHSEKVIDSTDKDKVKTIQKIIDEIQPEQQFKRGSEFKYIEPASEKVSRKIELSVRVINQLEEVLASVEPSDFEKKENLESLFRANFA